MNSSILYSRIEDCLNRVLPYNVSELISKCLSFSPITSDTYIKYKGVNSPGNHTNKNNNDFSHVFIKKKKTSFSNNAKAPQSQQNDSKTQILRTEGDRSANTPNEKDNVTDGYMSKTNDLSNETNESEKRG